MHRVVHFPKELPSFQNDHHEFFQGWLSCSLCADSRTQASRYEPPATFPGWSAVPADHFQDRIALFAAEAFCTGGAGSWAPRYRLLRLHVHYTAPTFQHVGFSIERLGNNLHDRVGFGANNGPDVQGFLGS